MSEHTPAKLPLVITCREGVLCICIGIDTLAWMAEHCPGLEDDRGETGFSVVDPGVFALEVQAALEDEQEDGTTLVREMLDSAIIKAVEDGADGLRED